jgi:hypothetical protein
MTPTFPPPTPQNNSVRPRSRANENLDFIKWGQGRVPLEPFLNQFFFFSISKATWNNLVSLPCHENLVGGNKLYGFATMSEFSNENLAIFKY